MQSDTSLVIIFSLTFLITFLQYYYAHQLEHQRVGPNVVERDDNILLDNLDACVDERIIYDEDEFKKRSFRCLICNTSYELHHDIRSHIRDRHVYKMFPPPIEPKKEFICDLCGLRLKTKAALKNHFLIHTNTKSHPCKICGKKFRQKSDRTIHERQHSGEVRELTKNVLEIKIFLFFRNLFNAISAAADSLVKVY